MKLLIFLLLLPFFSSASDHIDGVPTIDNGQVDISDLYAFPSNKGQKLNIILNTYPAAGPKSHFSYKVGYGLKVRRLKKDLGSNQNILKPLNKDTLSIKCLFSKMNHHANDEQKIKCKLKLKSKSILLTGNVGKIINKEQEGAKLYTGLKSDPFFISAGLFSAVTKRKDKQQKLFKKKNTNLMKGLNVLTLIFQLDLRKLGLGDLGLIGVAGESFIRKSGRVVDRVGRPEITNLSLHNYNSELGPLKVQYNAQPAFFKNKKSPNIFVDRLIENISDYDYFDGASWGNFEMFKFAHLLVNDFLVLDLSKRCSMGTDHFMEIEASIVNGHKHRSCGGRRLSDNIMETLYNLYIAKVYKKSKRIYSNGLSGPTPRVSFKFPFLAAPSKTSKVKMALFELARKNQEK